MRNHDPWGKFQAEHQELHREGILGKIVITALLVLAGAGVGAVVGALLNPGPRHTRIQRMLEDTREKVIFRMIIGAIIGGLSAGVFAYNTWRSMKD